MNLTAEQIQAIEQGEPVSLVVQGQRCVLIREDDFVQLTGVSGERLDGDAVYELIEAVMAEDDIADPGLESYQKYK